jgi:hypothetical protein
MKMNIETTTCISYEHLEILKYHAECHNMSLRTFISCHIRFAALWEKGNVKYFKQLKYRKRGDGQWKRFHLVLYEDEYEFFMDLKKLWKMSLAKVIAFCLDNVLEEFLRFLIKSEQKDDYYTDNYRYSGYSFEVGREEDIFYCKFYWGPHPEIVRKANT